MLVGQYHERLGRAKVGLGVKWMTRWTLSVDENIGKRHPMQECGWFRRHSGAVVDKTVEGCQLEGCWALKFRGRVCIPRINVHGERRKTQISDVAGDNDNEFKLPAPTSPIFYHLPNLPHFGLRPELPISRVCSCFLRPGSVSARHVCRLLYEWGYDQVHTHTSVGWDNKTANIDATRVRTNSSQDYAVS